MTRVVLVGEAWGRHEAEFEHAFVGKAGAELARMLAQVGLAPAPMMDYPSELDMISHWKLLRESHGIDLANVFNCRPEENKIHTFFTNAKEGMKDLGPLTAGKYLIPDLFFHLENLWKRLEELKPTLIIALGNTACWAVLGETKITAIRGTVKISPRLGIKVLPTYHPASIMYEGQWRLRPVILSDLEKAKTECEFPEIRRIERWITVEPTLDEIAEWCERPADFYAADIETALHGTNVKQIAMISFARNPHDALVIPFMDDSRPNWNFWPTIEEEVKAWRFVDKLLKRPIPKVFQNGTFDVSFLLRQGFRPTMCDQDTMLLHHSLYPEMLKGLGFLGSIYSREVAWKQMGGKGNNLKRDE